MITRGEVHKLLDQYLDLEYGITIEDGMERMLRWMRFQQLVGRRSRERMLQRKVKGGKG